MADDLNLLKQRSLFASARHMINTIVRDESPDSGNRHRGPEHERNGFNKGFRKPTPEEARYLKALCTLLHRECGIGDAMDPKDTMARIAKVGTPELMAKHLLVREDFFQLANNMLFHTQMNGRYAWMEEKTRPKQVLDLLAHYETFLRETKQRTDAQVEQFPTASDHVNMLLRIHTDAPNRRELFHSVYEPALEHLPITEKNQKFAKVAAIDADERAKVIYFGGMIQASEQPEFVNRAMRRIKRVLGSPREIPMKDYDIYVLTYNNRAQFAKSQNILRHTLDAEHFSSPTAKAVAQDYLRPLYADEDGMALPVEQLMKNMSLVTFVGYSYGTNFIQEVRNALVEEMKPLYPPEVRQRALSRVAAFNLSSIATVADKSAGGDFTQLHSAAHGDSATYLHSNIDELVAGDGNPFLKQFRREGQGGLHTLVMEAHAMPDMVISGRTEDAGLADAGFVDEKGKPVTVRTLASVAQRPDPAHHHIESNLNVDQIRPDDEELTLQNSPAAPVVMDAMRDMVRASIAVARHEAPERDTPRLLADVAERRLNAGAIERNVSDSTHLRAQVTRALARDEVDLSRRP